MSEKPVCPRVEMRDVIGELVQTAKTERLRTARVAAATVGFNCYKCNAAFPYREEVTKCLVCDSEDLGELTP